MTLTTRPRWANRPIAAGIGGSAGWRALTWAAGEAEQTGTRLVLLHVHGPYAPASPQGGRPGPAELELIDPPLARAVARVQERLGRRHVAVLAPAGDPSDRLVDASAGVRLLVIGDGEASRTVRRVLRHAYCPVVVVGAEAPASPGGPVAGHVVIGVDGTPASRAALDFGFAFAAEHGLPVAAVHVSAASHDDYFYDDVTLSTHFTTEPAALELLAAETEGLALKHPQVPVRRAVLHGSVVGALTRAGYGAALLVVGDKRRGVLGRVRTGDVPLAVATEASCPVAVVPVEQHEGDPL
ncbi:universal stress protein [Paractinoplanes deccanensis]|uniref:Universal stress protein n=1 Tax=Paractinoplanes deccanensis TaxID=113561 RepID=A0ABQ3YEQ5_9ACTN|nr:universal stress protein [Actinoplanes deccanensis]GID78463.1 universal stress protein [Actinoplanes deccanensis]